LLPDQSSSLSFLCRGGSPVLLASVTSRRAPYARIATNLCFFFNRAKAPLIPGWLLLLLRGVHIIHQIRVFSPSSSRGGFCLRFTSRCEFRFPALFRGRFFPGLDRFLGHALNSSPCRPSVLRSIDRALCLKERQGMSTGQPEGRSLTAKSFSDFQPASHNTGGTPMILFVRSQRHLIPAKGDDRKPEKK